MNSTTWILDLKDKISEPVNKVRKTFSDAMASVKEATKSTAKTQKELETKIKDVQKTLDGAKVKMTNSFSPKQIKEATAEVQRLEKELKDLSNININKGINNAIAPAKDTVSKIGGIMGGFFVFDRLKSFGGSVIDITGDFQKYQAVLTNAFNSEAKALQSMELLQKFATETPFGLNQLTDSYVKLVNRGFEPTHEEMTKLGDLASSTAKPFDQLVEAALDAQMGEFERLKEFGIKAKVEGSKVTLMFKEQVKQVANTPNAIKDALLNFGAMDGVKGSMTAIMDTLPGKISNMEDAWDAFKVKLGMGESPFISKIIDGITKVIKLITEHVDTIIQAISAISIGFMGASVAMGVWKTITLVSKVATLGLTAVMKGLYATMRANPFTAIAIGITAIVFAVMKAWQKFEGFRKFVYGLWGSIKETFMSMWNVVKSFFGGLGKMIDSLLNKDFKGIIDGAKQTGDALMQATSPVYFAYRNKDNITSAYKEESKKGIKSKEDKKSLPEEVANDKKKAGTGLSLPTGKDNKTKGEGSGGGSQIRNVTVTIQNLVGNMNFSSSTVKEGLGNIKSQITEALVSAVRDAEITMG